MAFLPKNLSTKFFRLKSTELSTEYRYRRYFFLKCTNYRYHRYFFSKVLVPISSLFLKYGVPTSAKMSLFTKIRPQISLLLYEIFFVRRKILIINLVENNLRNLFSKICIFQYSSG